MEMVYIKSKLSRYIFIALALFCLLFMTSYAERHKLIPEENSAATSENALMVQESSTSEQQPASDIIIQETAVPDEENNITEQSRTYNIQLDRSSPFYSVLFESGTFLCADQGSNNGKRLKITEVGHMVSQEGFFVDVLRYALVDIDKDGEKELLLDLDHYNGTVILKASGDEICGYYLWYRWMENIKDTGEFWTSGGMAGGTGKISFLKIGYETENVLYYEVKEFENRIAYTYNGVSITEEEYQQRLDAFKALPEPEWFEYWRSE